MARYIISYYLCTTDVNYDELDERIKEYDGVRIAQSTQAIDSYHAIGGVESSTIRRRQPSRPRIGPGLAGA